MGTLNKMAWNYNAIIKELVGYYNSLCSPFFPPLYKEENILVDNEEQRLKNIFNFIRKDNEYLYAPTRNKILRKIAKEMFDKRTITADELQAYFQMFDPIRI